MRIARCRKRGHVIDAVSACDHARDQGAAFAPVWATLWVGTLRCSSANEARPHLSSQRRYRDQRGTRHQIGIIKGRRRNWAEYEIVVSYEMHFAVTECDTKRNPIHYTTKSRWALANQYSL